MYCCINGCTNTEKNSKEKFYYFPRNSPHMPWLCEKRKQWVNAVKKHTKYSNDWVPTKKSTICSAHFVGNKKSENPTHESYLPTIFPFEENNQRKLVKKLQRFKRHGHQMHEAKFVKINTVANSLQEVNAEVDGLSEKLGKRSIGCQCNNLSRGDRTCTYFFCNLTNLNGVCTAEIQVNIASKRLVNKRCEANIPKRTKIMKDSSCGPVDQHSQGLHGTTSVTEENIIGSKAQALFEYCGRALQKRRQRREWKDLRSQVSREDFDADPAANDPELAAKLELNRQLALQKEAEVLEKFTRMEATSAKDGVQENKTQDTDEADSSSTETGQEKPKQYETTECVTQEQQIKEEIGEPTIRVKEEPYEIPIYFSLDSSIAIEISDSDSSEDSCIE